MSVTQKLKQEIAAVISLTLYFGCWLGVLVLFKYLLLTEYQIAFTGASVALVGALVLAKVVLVLEYVSFGACVRAQAAWVDVMLRTALYSFGVFVLLLLEKGFEGRHEYGGFGAALSEVFQHADGTHVILNTLCVTAAILSYNILSVIRKRLGKGALLKILLSPLPQEPREIQPD